MNWIKNIHIYITSHARAHLPYTLDELCDELKSRTHLVVYKEEYEDYAKLHKKIIVRPDGVRGLSDTRQWLIHNCGKRYIFLLDDDLRFFVRRDMASAKLERCTKEDQLAMFKLMYDWLKTIPTVGVSPRQGNNHVNEEYVDACRQMCLHGIDTVLYKKLGIRFNPLQVMGDFYMVLDFLTKGVANRVSYRYCYNQRGSGTAGGCSTYRTAEVLARCAKELEAAFPKYVKAVPRKTKTGWDGMKERLDVRIQWKKAYKDSQIDF